MKIFITGGNGFLGQNLLPLFNNAEYYAPTSKQVDVLDFKRLSNSIKNYKPDVILHMSAVCAGLLGNKNRPADFIRDNTQMGLNIYEAARINNIKYVYSLGSICMYHLHCPTPFKEDDLWNGMPELTNSPYGQSKRTLLMLSQTYRQQYGIGGAFLMPVNMYGYFDHFDLINSHVVPALINKFCNAVKNNLPVVNCWGTGNATRELFFAEDCCDAIVMAIMQKLDTDLPINLGVGKDITIKNLASLIGELTGFKGEIIFTGEVGDGQPKRLLDVSRAKELLGFTAKTSLKDGLIKTIEWYKNNYI